MSAVGQDVQIGDVYADTLPYMDRRVQVIDLFPGTVMVRCMEMPPGTGVTTISRARLTPEQGYAFVENAPVVGWYPAG